MPGGPPDWILHLIEYGFFVLTCIYGATRGFAAGERAPARVALAVAIASLYGITDEWHQSLVGRDATVQDWIADTAGALVVALVVLGWWRRSGPRPRA